MELYKVKKRLVTSEGHSMGSVVIDATLVPQGEDNISHDEISIPVRVSGDWVTFQFGRGKGDIGRVRLLGEPLEAFFNSWNAGRDVSLRAQKEYEEIIRITEDDAGVYMAVEARSTRPELGR